MHDEVIQQLSSIKTRCSTPRNEFRYKIPFKGLHKGFYIECDNIDEINEITLKINDNYKFIYDRFLIETKCVKINEQLLYLPMNYNKSYQGRRNSDFEDAIDLSVINSTILNVKFDTLKDNMCVYGLSSNELRVVCGMAGLAYDAFSASYHLYPIYQENGNYEYHIPMSSPSLNTDLVPIPILKPFIHKSITDKDKTICCITHDNIDSGKHYMSCNKCHNNFNEEPLRHWLNLLMSKRLCPMCKTLWEDFHTYINSEETN